MWQYKQPQAARLYILIYMIYEYIRESLKGIIIYMYMMIGILITLIRYIFSHDISSCYVHIKPRKIIKTNNIYLKQWRTNLARLNRIIKEYMLNNYKVIDYEVKKPSPRQKKEDLMDTIKGGDPG